MRILTEIAEESKQIGTRLEACKLAMILRGELSRDALPSIDPRLAQLLGMDTDAETETKTDAR